MPTSAIYGEAVYGDSRYGVILIKGSSSLTFNTLGVVSGDSSLRGSSILSFASTGTILGLGIRYLNANTSVSFDSSGRLEGTGKLLGSSIVSFDNSGTLIGESQLKTLSTLSLDTDAILVGSGRLLPAPIGMTFRPSAIIRGMTALKSSSSIKFSLSGYLNRFRIQSRFNTLRFNTKASTSFNTTLPWYNTIIPSDLKPYDTRDYDTYHRLYEDTEGSYRKPYQDTQKEVT